jgi:hypothetical protein
MSETETTTAAATAAIPAATIASRPRHVGNLVRGVGMFIAFTGLMALGLYALKQRVQGTTIETPAASTSSAVETHTVSGPSVVPALKRVMLSTGGVGYFGAGGDMDTCIALRTAVFKGGRIHVQAGGGVVFDSNPESEFMETVHKASALFRAAEEAARYDRGNC